MYIKELNIKFFKSIENNMVPLKFGVPNGEAGSGLNIFLGENNTGKSTIFEAFDFLRNNSKKQNSSIVNMAYPDEVAVVEIELTGDLDGVIEQFSPENKKAAFRGKIYKVGEIEHLKLQRTTADKRPLNLFNSDNGEFVNVSGIDAPLKSMFETNFVWADTNPQEEAKFGASTITGNLI